MVGVLAFLTATKGKKKTMKTLLRWLVKKFITKQDIKNAVHAANARLARREAGDRAQTVMGWGEDASQILEGYLKAYADDGRIDDEERAALDARCDAIVDKYVSDKAVEAIIDAIIK